MAVYSDKSVLIVDDMKLARLRVRQVCEKLGFGTIVEAESGRQAIEMLENKTIAPDIILTDYNMPEVNGLEFLTLVREHADLVQLPVIFITSESEKSFVLKALALGLTEFIMKPHTDNALAEKIESILHRSEQTARF